MFKCAKISFSKLSLQRELKTCQQFSFACFKLLDAFSLKSDSETLEHEVLPDNCQLKIFVICRLKLLLRMLAPFLFKWSLLLLDVLLWPFSSDQRVKKSLCHTFLPNDGWICFPFYLIQVFCYFLLKFYSNYNWWDTNTRFSDFNSEAKSIMVFAILSVWWFVWVQIICPNVNYKRIWLRSNLRFHVISHTLGSCSWEASHKNIVLVFLLFPIHLCVWSYCLLISWLIFFQI